VTTIVRPLNLDNLQLLTGGHKPPTGNDPLQACLLEAAAYMAGAATPTATSCS